MSNLHHGPQLLSHANGAAQHRLRVVLTAAQAHPVIPQVPRPFAVVQWLSNWSVHVRYPKDSREHRLLGPAPGRSEVGPKNLYSIRFPGDVAATGLRTPLWEPLAHSAPQETLFPSGTSTETSWIN